MDVKMWFEKLPENCPPNDAINPINFFCFRLTTHSPPTEKDYFSQRKIYPEKKFHVNECRARSLSVFNEKSDCENIIKLPPHRGKHIIALRLFPECGVIKKTGRSTSHFSWWVLSGFLSHLIIEEL
jgi:hypothetical protein